MRRPSKDSPKLSAESQRLVSISQAIVQAASRVEERTWERNLDSQLQKLLKTNHQDSIDGALNVLFKGDLAAYDVLMDCVEAVSESSCMTEQAGAADGAVISKALDGGRGMGAVPGLKSNCHDSPRIQSPARGSKLSSSDRKLDWNAGTNPSRRSCPCLTTRMT